MKILLVEDNEFNRDMLSRRLIKQGFDVVTAENGKQALEMTLSEKPDLILLDLSLPFLTGWEVAKKLKELEETKHIPIIALTAYAMDKDKELALKAGCNDFETKPIEFPRLLEKITHLTQKNSL